MPTAPRERVMRDAELEDGDKVYIISNASDEWREGLVYRGIKVGKKIRFGDGSEIDYTPKLERSIFNGFRVEINGVNRVFNQKQLEDRHAGQTMPLPVAARILSGMKHSTGGTRRKKTARKSKRKSRR